MRRTFRLAIAALLGLAGLALILTVAAVVIFQTDWFKNKVRARIVSVAETATGGRVEIGRFDYNWKALTVDVAPFVLHGKESPTAPPFVRANKIQVGLKILSVLKKQVDVASLVVEKPEVHIVVAADGSTNIPAPKIRRTASKNFIEQFLSLKARRFELRDGMLEYNSERIPIDIKGERLQVALSYESAGPRYVGDVSARPLHIASARIKAPVDYDFSSRVALDGDTIRLLEAAFTNEGSKIEVNGTVTQLSAPRFALNLDAQSAVKELNRMFGLPIESRGSVSFEGQGLIEIAPFRYQFDGKVRGRELAYAYKGIAIPNIVLASPVAITPTKVDLPSLEVAALHGRFRGSAQILDYKRLVVQGNVQDFSLKEVAGLGQRNTGELSGTLSGSIGLEGSFARPGMQGTKMQAKLDIVPHAGGIPVQGAVTIDYDQSAGKIQLGNSEINLGSTRMAASGTLGETLAVQVTSRNLNDFLPLFPIVNQTPPAQIPVTLDGGLALFDGSVTGPLDNPRVSGKGEVTGFALDKRQFDHVTGTFDIDKSALNLQTLTLEQGGIRVLGQGRIGLRAWKVEDSSALSLLVSTDGADVAKLAADYGDKAPVSGTLSATLRVTGTVESPLASGTVDVQNGTAYGEHFDRARGGVTVTATALEVANGEIRSGPARITLSGAYNHPASDWKDGSLRLDIASSQLTLAQIQHVQDVRQGLGGAVEVTGSGSAKVVKGNVSLTSLNGHLSLRNLVVDGRPYGNLDMTASTRLPALTLAAVVDLRGIQIQGNGEWRMEGDYPGQAKLQIPKITFATLHDLWPGEHVRKDLPFDGFLQGDAVITGPLNNPAEMKAAVTLSTVQMNASPNARPLAGAQAQDLVLKNARPVELDVSMKSTNIRSASFVAKDTTLNVAGRLAFDSKNPWDLTANGRINLSILQLFNADLLASGAAVMDVAVHGTLTAPQVDGRLELKSASLFLRDFPNSVDQANGLLLFDRNRATIQQLSAVTGGGEVKFEPGSFVGFRGPALTYGVQASARNVRYRSPDGISVTVDATMRLQGTSENSVLSGSVEVVRASFNPRTDVGSLLASTAKPVSVPTTPNEYLRGIQFDVNVTSSRSLEVNTSLTRNIQADANLRLRGTPERLVVLGNVSVNSGQIEFFGNKYTINRGAVNFYNPTKVEPIIDMDLETQVRSVIVNISFSGSLNKLNFSYRSDPPLETNEIIALLAVGRVPTTVGGLASSQTQSNTSYLATGSNALLGQAIAPASGRLQRFFGVSHIKIDPQLTDLTSIPQARLTLEQQVTTDVTLTYITNLARTDQQIIRVEWDFSKQWSVVALRDENGAFGIDFQYRKRFK